MAINMKSIKETLKNISHIFKIAIKYDFGTLIVIVLESILGGILPFILIVFPKYIIDELINNGDFHKVIFYIIVMGSSYLVVQVILYAVSWVRTLKTMKLYDYFGILLAEKAMHLDLSYIEDAESLNDFKRAENAIWYGSVGSFAVIVNVFRDILKFGGLIYLLSTLDFFIIILIFALALFDFICYRKNRAKIHKLYSEKAETDRKINYLSDAMTNFRYGKDIRLYNGKRKILSYYDYNVNNNLNIDKHISKLDCRQSLVSSVFSTALRALLYIFYAYKYSVNRISIGEFSMLIATAETFYSTFDSLVYGFMDLRNFSRFISDYRKYMEIPSKISNQGGLGINKESKINIEFKNVWFKYPKTDTYILKDISFMISDCSKTTIIGDNGAGKTTLVKLLLRFYDVSEGQILLNGVDIRDYNYLEYIKQFTTVFQDFKLFSFSLKDNIALSTVDYNKERMEDSLEKSGINKRIKNLSNGLDTYIFKNLDDNGIDFSGGEKQKIAIARALYRDASISILDEPTAALDPKAELEVYEKYNNLVKNKTAIYISHRMSSCKFCDKIIVIEDGIIVEQGIHQSLLEVDGIYKKMWISQSQYYQ